MNHKLKMWWSDFVKEDKEREKRAMDFKGERDYSDYVYSFFCFISPYLYTHTHSCTHTHTNTRTHTKMHACVTRPSVKDKIIAGVGHRKESRWVRRCRKNIGVCVFVCVCVCVWVCVCQQGVTAKENRSGFHTLASSTQHTQGKHRRLSHVNQPSGKSKQNLI